MQTDMTVGKPMKMILDFTIPVFIGNVFQQFYNMADAIIVGKFVGTKGLAAVGSTGTIMFSPFRDRPSRMIWRASRYSRAAGLCSSTSVSGSLRTSAI